MGVNLSCDSFFADVVAGGNNLFMCDRYLEHVSRRFANAFDIRKVKLEVLEKEGINLGRGREYIRLWKRQRMEVSGIRIFNSAVMEQEDRDKVREVLG